LLQIGQNSKETNVVELLYARERFSVRGGIVFLQMSHLVILIKKLYYHAISMSICQFELL